MSWFTGGKQGEAKKFLSQLADATRREQAARNLIGLDADAVPVLLEALQTRDPNLCSPSMSKSLPESLPPHQY